MKINKDGQSNYWATWVIAFVSVGVSIYVHVSRLISGVEFI